MRLTDLSQLTKAMVKTPASEPPSGASEKPASDDVAQTFAGLVRPAATVPQRPEAVLADEVYREKLRTLEAALEAREKALDALTGEKAEADRLIDELRLQLENERSAHRQTTRERQRLDGECNRLQGELRKAGQKPIPPTMSRKPQDRLPAAEGTLEEAFPGEVREQILAALAEALDAARQSNRERRAKVLASVLAANPPTGELDRRRRELKQILKDAGEFSDATTLAALERLGIRCVSGRKHWKLEYANLRMPMAKTPSDHRSALNCATDMANRFF